MSERIVCNDNGGELREEIEAWNTRAERTCKVVSKPCDMWECECGMAWWHAGTPNYCPSCGRMVVEE